MSTVVVAKKAGKVCIAADSLTSFGDLKLSSYYDAAHDKILSHDENHLGIVGSAAHQLVLESVFASKKITEKKIDIDLSSRLSIFESFRALHPLLKEKYLSWKMIPFHRYLVQKTKSVISFYGDHMEIIKYCTSIIMIFIFCLKEVFLNYNNNNLSLYIFSGLKSLVVQLSL